MWSEGDSIPSAAFPPTVFFLWTTQIPTLMLLWPMEYWSLRVGGGGPYLVQAAAACVLTWWRELGIVTGCQLAFISATL